MDAHERRTLDAVRLSLRTRICLIPDGGNGPWNMQDKRQSLLNLVDELDQMANADRGYCGGSASPAVVTVPGYVESLKLRVDNAETLAADAGAQVRELRAQLNQLRQAFNRCGLTW